MEKGKTFFFKKGRTLYFYILNSLEFPLVLELPSTPWCRPCSSLSFQLVPGAGPAALTLRCVHLGETPRPPARCRLRLRCSPARPRSRGPPSRAQGNEEEAAGGRRPALRPWSQLRGQHHRLRPPHRLPQMPRGCGAPAPPRGRPAGAGSSPRVPLPSWGPREPGGFPALLRPRPASPPRTCPPGSSTLGPRSRFSGRASRLLAAPLPHFILIF